MRGRIRCLKFLDLLVHQNQPLMLAMDLVLQPWRQIAPIAGTRLVQTRQEARLQGHGIADALAMQQPLDPVAVPGALLQQPLALARTPFAIFVLRRRNPNHAANPRFAALVSQKRAHQLRQVDPIGLGSPCPPVHLDARRIDLVIEHPVVGQPAVQPMTVETRFIAGQNTNRLPRLRRFRPSLDQQTRQRRQVASINPVTAHFLAARHHYA